MSVLVRGMEMPKNCLTCKLRGDGSDSKYIWDCPFTGFEYTREEGETGRLDECPIAEVPTPHGRLIDYGWVVENVIKKLGIKDKQYLLQAEKALMILVDEAPTVIEAEGTDA